MSAAVTVPTRPVARTEAPRRARRRGGRGTNAAWSVVAVLVFCAFVFPVYWMVNTSFQPSSNVLSYTPHFFPDDFTLRAYSSAINDPNPAVFGVGLRNSMLVTLLTLIVALFVGFAAALAATRFRFRGRRTFIIAILIIQMIPAEAMFVSVYKILDSWYLTNSIVGLGLAYTAAVLPFTIWTLRGFVNGVPVELEEAAMIDGCSRGRAFRKITFPLLAPGLVATGVFAFIQAWNEFVLALVVMTKPENVTLPVWLRFFQQATRATNWSGLMAGSVLMSIPVIVFFLFVQRRMTGGLVAGAVKG